jgi:hypothetical protein
MEASKIALLKEALIRLSLIKVAFNKPSAPK